MKPPKAGLVGPRCYDNCDCRCGEIDPAFDSIVDRETKFALRLNDILRAGVGWYSDKSVEGSGIRGWSLRGRSGLYFLWHKDDYCPHHERFHMRALYVGKGGFEQRLRAHWQDKDTSEELLVYFSFVELENRISKYFEQLLLDLYHFPLNTAENPGQRLLCAHFTQSEVDWGAEISVSETVRLLDEPGPLEEHIPSPVEGSDS